ncbi:TetR family transcriptional regulator [Nocardia terpenica]|uniref:TetR family transcriptional regulator n=1 Tax=Nocardia terpenica TaxID=455432 RepID=A0A6G9Z4Z0_9NOCA|nr:TetR family transcriptional regulator [Nocardia terpenica]QIS20461.1 TetR family transcriptional regulator [Nocardia terpenica]
MSDSSSSPAIGGQPDLRARRRAQTEREIHTAAVELSEARGFDQITVNDIAARAGVSQRTFFRYFPTKDSAVLYDQWGVADAIGRLITTLEPERIELTDIESVIATTLDSAVTADPPDGPDILRRYRLILATPQLAAAAFVERNHQINQLLHALDDNSAETRSRMRLLLDLAYTVLFAAVTEWAETRTNPTEHNGTALLDIYHRLCKQLRHTCR